MKIYASDFTKLRGRDKDDVLIKFYNETAHAKTTAVWYVCECLFRIISRILKSTLTIQFSQCVHQGID